jgi:hypothetical protein
MDVNTKTKSKTDASEQFREIAENGAAQSKKAFDTVSAATGEAANVMKNCYSTAIKGAQDYNNKVIEFTRANTNAVFDFAHRISGVKSPSELAELSTACTPAARDADQSDHTTRGARPASDARDRGAPQDRHHEGIRPALVS